MTKTDRLTAFQVPLGLHLLSACVSRFSPWWVRLGNLESRVVRDQIEELPIDRPIYITGIARAGTTILLETLARHAQTATHQYRDFPGHFTPVWWNRGQTPVDAPPEERAHGDRIKVTQDSPEAMEEPLWMAFFTDAHCQQASHVISRHTTHPQFEQFYRDHLRKILLVRGGSRYVAKGNYNLTRIGYLQSFLPDARFVIAVRHPRDHIASLMKQQRLFCAGETKHPRALAHMRWVGHFEFGLDRRPISIGDGVAEQVAAIWDRGEEVRGCARYWASLYGWLFDLLQRDNALRGAVQLVRFEDLCADPQATIGAILTHCGLPADPAIGSFATQISLPPQSYESSFSASEEAIIEEETCEVATQFGYHPSDVLAQPCLTC
jgi:hypothetical protein